MHDPTEFSAPRRTALPSAVAAWLLVMLAMLAGMVLLGGATRLTGSGLSMVEWRPLTGWLPPLDHAAWEAAFADYRRFPEYQHRNFGMTLGEFQSIFWLEYVHRLWGRLIGLAFALPLAVFVWRRLIDRRLALRLAGILVLGGLQGVMGWYMVQSGLADRPDVSQYRLAIHLGLAFLIMAAILWLWLDGRPNRGGAPAGPGLRRAAAAILVLVGLTAFAGGLVAGLDAGLIYNTFPLMDGAWIPDGLFPVRPWYTNLFEDVMTVQFAHRVLATAVAASILAYAWAAGRAGAPAGVRRSAGALVVVGAIQYLLGIATLLLAVPLPLGIAHQAGGMALVLAAVWTLHAAMRGAATQTGGVRAGATRRA